MPLNVNNPICIFKDPVRKNPLELHFKQERLIVLVKGNLHFHDYIGDAVIFLPDQFWIVVDILILRCRTRRTEGVAIDSRFWKSLAHIVKHRLSLVELRHPD